jgi:hypothetical protein
VLALTKHAGQHLQDLVETLEPAQRGERDAVGGVFPGA